MYLIGLTGGISTGKSLVSANLISRGYTLIDGDVIARQVVEPGQPALKSIEKTFGPTVIKDGALDRISLGNIIFNDAEKRKQLNQITHPEIYKVMRRKILGALWRREKYVFLDLPLLYESGAMVKYLSKVIVVSCDKERQLKRLIERNSLREEEAQSRIASQMPLEEKCARADFVIDNDGSREETLKNLDRVIEELKKTTHPALRYLLMDSMVLITTVALSLLITSFLPLSRA